MTKPATDQTMRRKTSASPYSAAWAVVGALGLGYLGVAFLAPQLLPDLSGGREHAAETTVMKVSADVDSLKSSLTKLELDIASVKAEVTAQGSQTQQLSSQLTALDDKVRLAEAPPATTTTTADASAPAGTDAAPAQDADSGPTAPNIINGDPRVGAPIETGSVNKAKAASKPISFGPAIVKPAPRLYGIQIATDPSVDGLRVTWGALSQIHPDQLSSLHARYADLGTATNPNYGLIAGPVKSKVEARKLCKELAAQSIACKISEYRGADL